MRSQLLSTVLCVLVSAGWAAAQQPSSCASLMTFKSSAKQLIDRYYGRPPAFSYFSGCSTGGREGMILSQRYPTVFDGIISGDPAMRTGLSNLAIGRWIPVTFNQIAPKDAGGKPIIAQALSDNDRKLITDALLKQCDAKDGLADGIISDSLGCDFDPAVLTCKAASDQACLAPEKVAAIKKAIGGPKTTGGVQVYPGFLYDTGITASGPIRGILSPGPGIFGPATTAMVVDVDKEALANIQPLVDSMSTNLTTFSQHGGKLIFYHGNSDPWFSPLDTFGYFKDLAAANGGLEAVSKWSQFYFVPGMDIAVVVQGSISLICLARSSTGLRSGSRPSQWSQLAKRFRVAAVHSVPIRSTRITRAREIRRMRTTSNAVDFQT